MTDGDRCGMTKGGVRNAGGDEGQEMGDNCWVADGDQDGGGKKNGAMGSFVQAESMIQLAIALPVGCVIGWFLGSLVDKHLHSHWVGIAGIILGAVGGFIQIFRTAQKYLKRGD